MKFQAFSKVPVKIIWIFSLIGILLPGEAISRTKALFNTKAEAKAAAKEFGCSGAHKMGKKWMPCSMHHEHNKQKK